MAQKRKKRRVKRGLLGWAGFGVQALVGVFAAVVWHLARGVAGLVVGVVGMVGGGVFGWLRTLWLSCEEGLGQMAPSERRWMWLALFLGASIIEASLYLWYLDVTNSLPAGWPR